MKGLSKVPGLTDHLNQCAGLSCYATSSTLPGLSSDFIDLTFKALLSIGDAAATVVQELSQHFKLQDLGPTTQLLGIEIHRDHPNHCLSISQSQFISNLIQEHGLSDSKSTSTPLNPGTRLSTSMCPQNNSEAQEMQQHPYISVVGSLMYLAVTTRPDIAYAAGVLA